MPAPDDHGRFAHLMTPGRIGTMDLRNRVVMCPMGVLFGNADGSVSDNEAAFYEARARGGAGLLIIGTACVAYPRGTNHERMPAVSDDRYLPGMRGLAERVHRHGARVAAQLNFMGVYSFLDMTNGHRRIVPYPMAMPSPDRISQMMSPDEMAQMAAPFLAPGSDFRFHVATEDDLAWIVERFADAAERCRRAGYDGVEIHAGHGYLIDEFLSPRNQRDDGWGGDLQARARLLLEVIAAIRARVGRDYPVWMRVNAVERHYTVGEEFDEQCRVIEMAAAAGIDAVHLTAYANTDVATNATDSYAPHVVGPLGDYAARVRTLVDLPVITFGRYEPDEAEAVLAAGKADFVAMGRKLLADPDLPAKLASGRVDEIKPCIYQYRCIGNIALRVPARCVVSPQTGREHDLPLVPTEHPQHVLVVGGGPAGMEAARLLAARGHRVTLREAGTELGGTLAIAASADPILDAYLGWLRREVDRCDVAIELGAPVDVGVVPDDVDAIVVATGARWDPPDVALDDGARLLGLHDVHAWLRADDDTIGLRLAILGPSKAALSIAEVAAGRGREVTVIGPDMVFGLPLGMPGRFRLIAELEERGVHLVDSAVVARVSVDGVEVVRGEAPEHIPADSVLGIAAATPANPLAEALRSAGHAVHVIGDAHELRCIEGATDTALAVARAIG